MHVTATIREPVIGRVYTLAAPPRHVRNNRRAWIGVMCVMVVMLFISMWQTAQIHRLASYTRDLGQEVTQIQAARTFERRAIQIIMEAPESRN